MQVVQLTSLRPTADLFCSLLRDALKSELQRGQMKVVKPFIKSLFSESLVSTTVDDGKDPFIAESNDPDPNSLYLGGLGLKFKFPGDPRKYVARV